MIIRLVLTSSHSPIHFLWLLIDFLHVALIFLAVFLCIVGADIRLKFVCYQPFTESRRKLAVFYWFALKLQHTPSPFNITTPKTGLYLTQLRYCKFK